MKVVRITETKFIWCKLFSFIYFFYKISYHSI